MEKILYASMGKVTGPYASQFYSVHVFFLLVVVFFFFFSHNPYYIAETPTPIKF